MQWEISSHDRKIMTTEEYSKLFKEELLINMSKMKTTFLSDDDTKRLQFYCMMQSLKSIQKSHPSIYNEYTEFIEQNNLRMYESKNSMYGTLMERKDPKTSAMKFEFKPNFNNPFGYDLFFKEKMILRRLFILMLKLIIPIVIFITFARISNPFISCIYTVIAVPCIWLNKEWLEAYVPHLGILNLGIITLVYAYLFSYSTFVLLIEGERTLQIIFGILIGLNYFLSTYKLMYEASKSRSVIGKIFRVISLLLCLLNNLIIFDLTLGYMKHPGDAKIDV